MRNLSELPRSRVVLCDVTPRQLLGIAGALLPSNYRDKLKNYNYGMGAFKIDWALSAPVPWRAQECSQAATVHLGASLPEIARSERMAWRGLHANQPFVLVAQPSLFDASRAPAGKHTLWAYCHVPNGSSFDMTERIVSQIERFAPGFRKTILAPCVGGPAELERRNANLVGGDINGGAATLGQLFFRPTRHLYSTPAPGLYLCSSSTPPGGGVHGSAAAAAKRALRELFLAGGFPSRFRKLSQIEKRVNARLAPDGKRAVGIWISNPQCAHFDTRSARFPSACATKSTFAVSASVNVLSRILIKSSRSSCHSRVVTHPR